jgi:hypothetical protein
MYQSIILLLLSIDISSIICLIFFAVKRNYNDYKPLIILFQIIIFLTSLLLCFIYISYRDNKKRREKLISLDEETKRKELLLIFDNNDDINYINSKIEDYIKLYPYFTKIKLLQYLKHHLIIIKEKEELSIIEVNYKNRNNNSSMTNEIINFNKICNDYSLYLDNKIKNIEEL